MILLLQEARGVSELNRTSWSCTFHRDVTTDVHLLSHPKLLKMELYPEHKGPFSSFSLLGQGTMFWMPVIVGQWTKPFSSHAFPITGSWVWTWRINADGSHRDVWPTDISFCKPPEVHDRTIDSKRIFERCVIPRGSLGVFSDVNITVVLA